MLRFGHRLEGGRLGDNLAPIVALAVYIGCVRACVFACASRWPDLGGARKFAYAARRLTGNINELAADELHNILRMVGAADLPLLM